MLRPAEPVQVWFIERVSILYHSNLRLLFTFGDQNELQSAKHELYAGEPMWA